MFGLGTTEIVVVGLIAMLLFGGKRLAELGRGLGRSVSEFKKGMREVDTEVTKPLSEPSRPPGHLSSDGIPVASAPIAPALTEQPREGLGPSAPGQDRPLQLPFG